MNKNAAKIKAGIIDLVHKPFEIKTGTVVPGSVDTGAMTVRVQGSDGSKPIEGVTLNVITELTNGLVLIPADGSNIIMGSVDGPGEWAVLKASEITKAIITIQNVVFEIDNSQVNIQNGDVVFTTGASVFKMNTASEGLFQLLNDLITAISVLTVGTSTGPSTVPVNVASFNNLLTRLGNLLSA